MLLTWQTCAIFMRAKAGSARTLQKGQGQALFEEGSPNNSFYLLMEGELHIREGWLRCASQHRMSSIVEQTHV